MSAPKPDHVELAERLQLALLREFDRLLETGAMSPTDRATLAKLLKDNGWSLDPSMLPESLKDKLQLPPHDADLEDERVIHIAGRGRKAG